MKKIIAVLLAVMLCLTALPVMAIDTEKDTLKVSLGEPFKSGDNVGIPVYVTENSKDIMAARFLVVAVSGDSEQLLTAGSVVIPTPDHGGICYSTGGVNYNFTAPTVGQGDKAVLGFDLEADTVLSIPDTAYGYRILLDCNGNYAPKGKGLLCTVYFKMPTELGPYDYKLIWSDSSTSTPEMHNVTVTADTVTYIVRKDVPAPDAPIGEEITSSSITLAYTEGYEYKIDDGEWTTDNVFGNLDPNTEYAFYCRVAQTDTTNASPASSATKIFTDKLKPSVPALPTLSSATDTSITLNPQEGVMFKMNDGDWQESNVFSGLEPNTEYTFYAYVPAGENNYASELTEAVSFATDKFKPAIPAAPTAQQITHNSVTLNTIDGCLYKVNDGEWQQSNVFTGLSHNTEYIFYAYIPESENGYASEISQAVIKTDKFRPATPTVPTAESVTDTSVTVTAVDGVWYRLDDGAWQQSNVFEGLSPNTSYTVYAYIPEGENSYASEIVSLAVTTDKFKPATPAAPGVEAFTCDTVTLELIDGAQYKYEGGTWQESNVFTGLSYNTEYTFYAYIPASQNGYASEISEGTAATTDKFRPENPKAELESKTETSVTLKAVEGAMYKVNDGEWQNSNVFIGLDAETEYTFYVYIPAGEDSYQSDIAKLKVTTNKAYTLYDVNNDGSIDTSDLSDLKLFLAGVKGRDEIVYLAADTNSDTLVDTTDLSNLKLQLAGV